MIRGTTPSIIFDLPIGLEDIEAFELVIQQDRVDTLVFDKDRIIQANLSEGSMVLKKRYRIVLTQEETLKLSAKLKAYVQCRIKTNAGSVIASTIEKFNVGGLLRDGVL